MHIKILDDVAKFDDLVCTEVKWMFGEDCGEIGTSDISICANNILGCYYNHPSEASDEEFYIVRNSVNHALSNLEYIRQNY